MGHLKCVLWLAAQPTKSVSQPETMDRGVDHPHCLPTTGMPSGPYQRWDCLLREANDLQA